MTTNWTPPPRIPLTRLWRKTSAKGGTYYLGRLGAARVLAFVNERKQEGSDYDLELFLCEIPAAEGATWKGPSSSQGGNAPVRRFATSLWPKQRKDPEPRLLAGMPPRSVPDGDGPPPLEDGAGPPAGSEAGGPDDPANGIFD